MASKYFSFKVPFEGMFATPEEIEREKQWRYEEAVVKRILKRYKLDCLAKQLWRAPLDRGEEFGRLTFSDFQASTDFPMWLGTCRIRPPVKATLIGLLEHFRRSPIWWELREVHTDVPPEIDGCPVGLVFPLPRIKFLVAHEPVTRDRSSSTQILLQNEGDGRVLILQELDELLDQIGPPLPEPVQDREQFTWRI